MARSPNSTPGCSTARPAGPEPGSRTHQARRDNPCLLYLVRARRWQKSGAGDQRRVNAHRAGGAEVIQVLRAPFGQVMLAEKALRDCHRGTAVNRAGRGMITSFGQGTEVTRARVAINLRGVLAEGEDVAHWFA